MVAVDPRLEGQGSVQASLPVKDVVGIGGIRRFGNFQERKCEQVPASDLRSGYPVAEAGFAVICDDRGVWLAAVRKSGYLTVDFLVEAGHQIVGIDIHEDYSLWALFAHLVHEPMYIPQELGLYHTEVLE